MSKGGNWSFLDEIFGRLGVAWRQSVLFKTMETLPNQSLLR